ncbi:type VI secretion system-associated protein TagF [Shewanella sp. Scap07]|uniref:type VI secretion system-associated protein TagF n=1 Tax=Shewanella sp. Scap07 TaxID=2589987 RepID=UPI0015BC8A1A|nr:type VI secretion system-associated protein TagF [Shewanella sp. Scap07]QLE86826.1 type VI secretion system-associated protein TagF [Shewanella sp. Scap07]
MSSQPLTQIGYCGKVPFKGDFVQHNLSADFIKSWNEWLQAVVAVSKEQIPEQWLDCYLTSPVWHFALSADLCCESAMLGTLIPSVDQVSRHYPFTLAATHKGSPLAAWQQADQWAPQFQQSILQVLDDDCNLETWLKEIASQISFPTAAPAHSIITQHTDPVKKAWVLQGHQHIEMHDLLHRQYSEQLGRYSIWWTEGSQWVAPCVVIAEGLPQVSQFVSMINGQWVERDWNLAAVTEEG